jgi:hypothetical protein
VIEKLRQEFSLAVLLCVAQIPRSTYYYHVARQAVPDKYAGVKKEIATIYEENRRRVGYRRITAELHGKGCGINHKTVQRLMRQMGLFCRVRMKRYSSYRGDIGKVASNLLQRDFSANRQSLNLPNRLGWRGLCPGCVLQGCSSNRPYRRPKSLLLCDWNVRSIFPCPTEKLPWRPISPSIPLPPCQTAVHFGVVLPTDISASISWAGQPPGVYMRLRFIRKV